MKIRVLSDLHLEFSEHKFDHIWTPGPDDKEITLLLAGDIDVGNCSEIFVDELCKHFKYVLKISGNHEFYHHDFERVISDWKDFELNGPKNFHFLHNDGRILDGVRFLGGTMWTSFNDGDPMVMATAHRGMNDYVQIHCRGERITPAFILKQHDEFMEFLLKKFDEPFDGKTVVMTHHSPGNVLKCRGRMSDLLDHCYFANLDQLIGHHDIVSLWLHGHVHQSYDYMINNTRVVCNPYGYLGYSTNPTFDKDLILEI
jgi:hypothetical protein